MGIKDLWIVKTPKRVAESVGRRVKKTYDDTQVGDLLEEGQDLVKKGEAIVDTLRKGVEGGAVGVLDTLGDAAMDALEQIKPNVDTSKFIEQYYLIENLGKLHQFNVGRFNPQGYKNFTCLNATQVEIENELKANPGQLGMLDIAPVHQAYLVPKIRIFKRICGSDGKSSMIEYPFKANYDQESLEAILGKNQNRGAGVGIQDFQVQNSSIGKTMAGLGRQLSVDLSLYAQNAGEFFTQDIVDGHPISFTDFINRGVYAQTEFRVVVGWANPRKYPPGLFSDSLKEAIKRQRVVFECNVINHTVNIEQNGQISVNLTMNGMVESVTGFRTAKVFSELPLELAIGERDVKTAKTNRKAATEAAYAQRAALKSELASLDQRIEGATEAKRAELQRTRESIAGVEEKIETYKKQADENAEKLEKEFTEKEKEELTRKLASILAKLKLAGQLYYIDVPEGAIAGTRVNYTEIEFSPASGPVGMENWTKPEEGFHRIEFFYFGSLIGVIYEIARENEQAGATNQEALASVETGSRRKCDEQDSILDRLVPILGPLVLKQSDQLEYVNLADVPISVGTYVAWHNKVVVDKDLRQMSLRKFIEDIVDKLLGPALNHAEAPKRKDLDFGTPKMEILDSFAAQQGESRIHLGGRFSNVNSIKKTQFIDPETPEALFRKRYIHQVIHIDDPSKTSYLKDIFNVSEEESARRGVYRLRLGRDRGLVNNISFSREENGRLEAMRTIESVDKNSASLVPEKYNAEVSMYGNTIFQPGQFVVIDSMLPGLNSVLTQGTAARELGLGGLYIILSVTYRVSSAGFDVSLQCKQEFSLEASTATGTGGGMKPVTRAATQAILNPSAPAASPSTSRKEPIGLPEAAPKVDEKAE